VLSRVLEGEFASLFSEAMHMPGSGPPEVAADLSRGSLFQYAPIRVGDPIVPETRLGRALPRLANSDGSDEAIEQGDELTKPSISALCS
jgi:hypothetical protein